MSMIVIILVGAFLLAVRFTYLAAKEFVHEHGIHALAFRLLILRPLHGERRTDATFWHGSTDRATGSSSGRHHRAGVVNLGISLGVITLVVLIGYGLLVERLLTLILTIALIASVAVLTSVLGLRRARRWHRNRGLITPLTVAAQPIIDPDGSLGLNASAITMVKDWDKIKKGKLGEWVLPDSFQANDGQREALENLVTARYPVPMKYRWETKKMPQRLVFLASPALPREVRMRDWADKLDALPLDQFGVGVDANGDMYVADHGGEYPWHGKSANTGTGKSVAYQVKVAQILRKDPDADIYCFDTKQVSFEPLRGVSPRLHIFNSMADIWQGWYDLKDMMRQRYLDLRADPTAIDRMNNVWILVDEGNDMHVQLAPYYLTDVRQQGDPATMRIWQEAIAPLVWQGRQVKMRGEFSCQIMMEKYFGGVNLRTSFSVIGMAGYRPNGWKAIIQTLPVPKCQPGRGRIMMVRGGTETWVQGFYDDEDWIREYASTPAAPMADVIPLAPEIAV